MMNPDKYNEALAYYNMWCGVDVFKEDPVKFQKQYIKYFAVACEFYKLCINDLLATVVCAYELNYFRINYILTDINDALHTMVDENIKSPQDDSYSFMNDFIIAYNVIFDKNEKFKDIEADLAKIIDTYVHGITSNYYIKATETGVNIDWYSVSFDEIEDRVKVSQLHDIVDLLMLYWILDYNKFIDGSFALW